MRRIPPVLLAVPALGLARLLPATGFGLGLRLAAATGCVLIPGVLVARAIRVGGLSAALAWTTTVLFAAMMVMFALHTSFWVTAAGVGAIALVALPFALRFGPAEWDVGFDPVVLLRRHAAPLGVLAGGIGFGIALWYVAGFDGDAFFHLGRMRKLLELGSLSLNRVDEFRDGGLHPGYAFPLWHGFVALVSKLAVVDPATTVLHLPTVLTPLSFLLFYEAGHALFGTIWAGVGTVLAQVALTGLADGHGGGYRSLALPPTSARQLLLPAVLALFFAHCRDPSGGKLASLAAASLGLALVHPSYAIFVCIPLLAFFVVRALTAREEIARAGAALLVVALPATAFIAWLLPIVNETASHSPGRGELRRAFSFYAGELVGNFDSYRLAAPLFSRSGAVAVAALLVLPLAGVALAARRRWASYVLPASVAIFLLTLVPFIFPPFADAVSVSQGRRLAGFMPFSFALVGGAAVLSGLLGPVLLPLALGAGIGLQLAYPGVFGYHLREGVPAFPAWVAFAGGAVALVAGLVVALFLRRRPDIDRAGPVAALAVAVFVLPVAVHGFRAWSVDPADLPTTELTKGLVEAVRTEVPKGDVVYADPQTSYLLGAFAPVYIANGPIAHVADTSSNQPKRRLRDAKAFYTKGGDLAIPRRYGARWIVVSERRRPLTLKLPQQYADGRYVLYRLR
ncbi:MAG: hypothetical protein M3R70_13845 [Actinomycetota bacterium]|nr:hypothetical protein [Actinomycetota bacterium]